MTETEPGRFFPPGHIIPTEGPHLQLSRYGTVALCFLLAGCLDAQTPTSERTSASQSDSTTLFEDERATIEPGVGSWAAHKFELYATARVDWEIFERTGNGVNVCIIPASESRSWENGEAVRGWTCHERVTQYSDHVTLAAGDYSIAFRTEHDYGATVTYSVWAT